MIERLLAHDGRDRGDDLSIGDRAVRGHPSLGVLIVLAAEPHEQVRHGLAQQVVLVLAALLDRGQLLLALLLQSVGFRAESIRLRVIKRPHVRFGDRRASPQDALLAAPGAGAVSRHERVVVAAHHEHVAQGCGLRILRTGVVVEAEILLRRIRQQIQEGRPALVLGVDFLGFLHHAQRIVLATRRDTGRASLAEIRHEDGEDTAAAWLLLLWRREDRVRLLERHRDLVEDVEELRLGAFRETIHLVGDLADQALQRSAGALRDRVTHQLTRTSVDLRHQPEHLLAFRRILDVVRDRCAEQGVEILRAVGQCGIRTDGDAFHALGAVLGNVQRRLAPGDVLRCRVAASCSHDTQGSQRRRGLVVSVVGPELGVERGDSGQGRAFLLALWDRVRATARSAAGVVSVRADHR